MNTGEVNRQSKLTEGQVLEIRFKYRTTRITQQQLGKLYGVHKTTINRAISRYYWRHVK